MPSGTKKEPDASRRRGKAEQASWARRLRRQLAWGVRRLLGAVVWLGQRALGQVSRLRPVKGFVGLKAGRFGRVLSGRGRGQRRRLLVLERTADDLWKAVEAEVGGEQAEVLEARVAEAGRDGLPDLSGFGRADDVVLVSHSGKAVCRLLELPAATPDQLQRMVAHHLEMELPYPVDESTWVAERQLIEGAGSATSVLVIATPRVEIDEAWQKLRLAGRRPSAVECDAGCLAELTRQSEAPERSIALADVEVHRTTLVITRSGKLRYARRLRVGSGACEREADAADQLAGELDQSIRDYVLHTDGQPPDELMLVGPGSSCDRLANALRRRLDLPVGSASLAGGVRVGGSPVDGSIELAEVQRRLLAEFPACVGAVLATDRRRRGEETAAPALTSRPLGLAAAGLRRKAALVLLDLVLLAAVVWAAFAVRQARSRAATRAIDEMQPSLASLEQLEEEVDILQRESRQQRAVLDALLAVSEALPTGVQVATLEIDPKGQVTISGKAPSVEAVSQQAIVAMEASPVFAAPKFLGATQEKEGIMFRISCELRIEEVGDLTGTGGSGP